MDNHQAQALVPTTPQPIELPVDTDVFRVGEVLAKSGYFKDVKDMAQAVAKILAGREMGFGPIASLTGVYIQQGRPCYSANMIAAAIKKSRRYDYRVKHIDATQCDLEFYEGGKPVGVSSFTMQDAVTANLTTGTNAHSWKHYPRNMLFARALTNGARFYCPDTFGGIPIYTPEELNVAIDGETGEAVRETTPTPLRTIPSPQPSPPSQPQEQPTTSGNNRIITKGQTEILLLSQRRSKVSDADFKRYLSETYHVAELHEVKQKDLNRILEWLEFRQAKVMEEEPAQDEPQQQTRALPVPKPENAEAGIIVDITPKRPSQNGGKDVPAKLFVQTMDGENLELAFFSRPDCLKEIEESKWPELKGCGCEFTYTTEEKEYRGKMYKNHRLGWLALVDASTSVIDDGRE